MYSPKIKEALVPNLYREAKRQGVRMTVLVNRILAKEIAKFKKGGEELEQNTRDA